MKRQTLSFVKTRAKELRKDMSPAERMLWQRLRRRQLLDLHVRRQSPIENYIVDFCIESCKLVIELDGVSHDYSAEHDAERDSYLNSLGYAVIRISNQQVLSDIDTVLDHIRITCESRM